MVSYLDSLMTLLNSFPFYPTVSFLGALTLAVTRRWRHTAYFLVAMALVGAIAVSLKTAVHAPRPYVKQGIEVAEKSHIPFRVYDDDYASFPSMHAMTAFAPVGIFHSAYRSRRLTVALCGFAALVAYSRVYLSLHHVSDVVVGGALGMGVSFLVLSLGDTLQSRLG
ncbi:phosphatase PAP2 family protein [Halorutilales archaeon Cl-col2-1]